MKLGILKRDERGFTLIEMALALAVANLILVGFSSAYFQIVKDTDKGVDRLEALHDIEIAATWLTRDIRSADTIDLVDGALPVSQVEFQWTEEWGGTPIQHMSSYNLSGTDLIRIYDGSQLRVASYVSNVEFSISGNTVIFTLESTPGFRGVTEERTYNTSLRPTS